MKSAYAHMMSRRRADSVFIFLQQDVSEKRFHNKAIEFFMEIGLTQFKNKLRGRSTTATWYATTLFASHNKLIESRVAI